MNLPWLDPNAGRSPIGEGLSGIADSLMESRRMDQQRQQQMADTLLRKKQTEVEERRALAEEGRQKIAQQREDRAVESQRQKDYTEALHAIKKHLTPGPDYDPDYAAALAEQHGVKGLAPEQNDTPDGPPPPMGQPPSPAMSAPPPEGPPPPSFAMGPPGRVPSMQAHSQASMQGMGNGVSMEEMRSHPDLYPAMQPGFVPSPFMREKGTAADFEPGSLYHQREQHLQQMGNPDTRSKAQWDAAFSGTDLGAAGPDRSAVEPPPMSPGGGPPVEERDQHRAANAGYAQQLADHPQLVGEHAQAVEGFKAHRATTAQSAGYPVFRAKGPNGEDLRFDTGTGQQSLQQERNEVTQRGLAAADAIEQQNPGLKPMADKTRALAQYVKAGLMKPADFATHIEKLIGMENQVSIAQGHDTTRVATAKLKKGGGGGTGTGEGYNPKVERANKAALANLDTSTNRYAKTSGLEALTKAHEEAERAMESLNTGNPAGAAHALEKFVSVSRGGMATNAALKLFQQHLSGIGGTAEGAIEGLKSGGLGEEKTKNLHAALEQVQKSIKEQVEIKRQAFVRDYVASPAYREMKGNTEDAYDKLFSPFGYKTEYDPNAKTIALGTGQRAKGSGRGGEAGAETHPLVSAAKQGKLSPADQQKAVMARQRLQKNPADAVAKEWLQAHGL